MAHDGAAPTRSAVRVFATRDKAWLAERTARALAALPGVAPAGPPALDLRALGRELASASRAVWLVRAGAFGITGFEAPRPSSTGRALCALGAVAGDAAWRDALRATGGDLARLPDAAWASLPIASAWLDAEAARGVGLALAAGVAINTAVGALRGARRIRFAPLDVAFDPRMRVAQAVTSLQQGGAERVALALHRALLGRGLASRLYTVDRPSRAPFAPAPGVVDLSASRGSPDAVARALTADATAFGTDLLHAHLLATPTLRALASRGFAPVVTAHNARDGWPAGLDTLTAHDARLLVACSLSVEAELRAAVPDVPVRTAWNGVDVAAVARSAGRGPALRRELAPPDALVLVTVANPRPQKRLDAVPAVLASLARRAQRPVRWLLVGDRHGRTSPARAAEAALAAAVERHGVAGWVLRVDSTDDVDAHLGAGDVYLSTSAFEGLSLALLEALAAGLPAVATDVGGAREVADGAPALRLVPADATADAIAEAVLAAAAGPRATPEAVARFTEEAMATRHERLYRRALRRPRDPRGVWLVTNNFSTGGAQSSARRLLTGLARRGVPVTAVTLQEAPERPTAGRRALVDAGVRVLCLPPPERASAAAAVDALVAELDAAPPASVLLWNALAEHKVRLADALVGVDVIDVSPGEMYFASLGRFFEAWRARPELPVRDARDYGRRLRALVVKYAAEAPAAAALGAPVHVIPNGVPLPGRVAPGGGGGRLVLGTAARIATHKRLEELLRALRAAAPGLPPHVLRIAGGVEAGSERYAEALRAEAEGLAVEWAGELGAVDDFLAGLDVFVMASEPAGCPNASLEAMAAGLPLVVTDGGGAREQVEHGLNGLVCPRGDAGALADALVELARDPGRRRAFGLASRERAAARFSLDRMLDDYERLLAGPAPDRVTHAR